VAATSRTLREYAKPPKIATMTTRAATSSGVEDRVPAAGGSEDGGRDEDLAEDFLPISWSVHSTAPSAGRRDRRNMGRSAVVSAKPANTTA
jgi:hypothetical protein